MALAPSGELTSIGIAKETTFGTAVSPAQFLICSDVNINGTNEYLERPGSRKRIGRTKPGTGMYAVKGSLSHECDPDNTGSLLALTMGTENVTANAANPSAAAVTTTLTAPVPIGFVQAIPAAMTNITKGQSLTIDTGGLAETVVVQQVTATGFFAYFTKAHASTVAIVNASVVLAYDHTFTLGSPRSSFTLQLNRVLDAVNFFGCKSSQLSLKVSEKSIIEAVMTIEGQADAYVGSPTTPSYSTLFPFRFESVGNTVKINGVASDATIMSWGVDITTGLIVDFPSFGNGRLRAQMPETMTKVSGTMELAFETRTMMQNFWGLPGSTGPQDVVLPVPLDFKLVSSENVNTAVPYALEIIMGTCQPVGDPIDVKPGDYLKQAVKFECYESINGASDDVKLILTNGNSGSSI
jgi:Phage tail tube protein